MLHKNEIPVFKALDSVQANVVAFLKAAGEKIASVEVKLNVNGGTASIDFKRDPLGRIVCVIMFPIMPAQATLSREEFNRWLGYAIHETCHALYSQRPAWNDAVAQRIHNLVNGMEDVRIERLLNKSGVIANSYEILTGLIAWCVAECPANYDPNDMRQLPWTLAMIGRVQICGYDIPGAMVHIAKLSPANKALIAWIMADLKKTKSTRDVLTLANKIRATLKPEPEPEPEPETTEPAPEPMDGDSSQESGDGMGETESPSTEPGDGESGSVADDMEHEPDNSDSSGSEKAGSGDASDGAGNPGSPKAPAPEPFDVKDCEAIDMNPVSEESKRQSRKALREAYANNDLIEARRGIHGKALPNVDGYGSPSTIQRLIDRLMTVNKLKNQVASVLRSSDLVEWQRNRPAGRLDRGALARIGAGQTENVFTMRKESQGYETEIIVLLDASGSMNADGRNFAASVFGMAVASAAYQVGVPCEVIAFSTGYFRTVKAPKDKPRSPAVMSRFAVLASTVQNFTPLSESIVRAACRLTARAPHKRRMVFAVTDGGCDYGAATVRQSCDIAASMGVEVVALCIDLEPEGFPMAARCSAQEVAKAGLGTLEKALRR